MAGCSPRPALMQGANPCLLSNVSDQISINNITMQTQRPIEFRYRLELDRKLETHFYTLEEMEKEHTILRHVLCKILSRDAFTGFFDKNSKKIFESDILAFKKTRGKKETHYWTVLMYRGKWSLKLGNQIQTLFHCTDNHEIAGNTHQHPELLTQAK